MVFFMDEKNPDLPSVLTFGKKVDMSEYEKQCKWYDEKMKTKKTVKVMKADRKSAAKVMKADRKSAAKVMKVNKVMKVKGATSKASK